MTAPAARPMSDFEIVGELGPTGEGHAYLARDRSTHELVAVRSPDPHARDVAVLETLNSSVPAAQRQCMICRIAITDWRRFCSQCGADLSGVDVAPEGLDAQRIVEDVLNSSERPVDLIGRMKRSEGGGDVWFGRNRKTGEIVALDLTRRTGGGGSAFDVAVTATMPAPAGAEPATTRFEAPVPAPPEVASAQAAAQVKVCPNCNKKYTAAVRFCPDDGSVLRLLEATDSLIGEIIANRYLIRRRIGQGGMGQVYLAEHVKMNRRCAIKVLSRELSNDVQAVSRFAREATNASRINDLHVAHIYDFGETPEHGVYLAMEFVDGDPLGRVLANHGPFDDARAIEIAIQVSAGLEAAHAEGVIHRDLTPNNIMVGRTHDGSDLVKVVDFGIAKATEDLSSGLTRTGFVVGTPVYMSPEQLLAMPVDARSDIYQLGCVVFEMLTAAPPFGHVSGPEQMARRLSAPPPRVIEKNTSVLPALSDLVFRALAPNVEERFQSAAEIRAALVLLATDLVRSKVGAPKPAISKPGSSTPGSLQAEGSKSDVSAAEPAPAGASRGEASTDDAAKRAEPEAPASEPGASGNEGSKESSRSGTSEESSRTDESKESSRGEALKGQTSTGVSKAGVSAREGSAGSRDTAREETEADAETILQPVVFAPPPLSRPRDSVPVRKSGSGGPARPKHAKTPMERQPAGPADAAIPADGGTAEDATQVLDGLRSTPAPAKRLPGFKRGRAPSAAARPGSMGPRSTRRWHFGTARKDGTIRSLSANRLAARMGAIGMVGLVVAGLVYGTVVAPIHIGPITLGFRGTAAPEPTTQDPAIAEPPDPGPVPLSQPTSGLVLGAALPAGAVVEVDGGRIQVESNVIALDPGTHDIVIRVDGFRPAQHRVTVVAAQQAAWTPRFEALQVPRQVTEESATAQANGLSEVVGTARPPLPDPGARPPASSSQPASFAHAAGDAVQMFRRALEGRDLAAIRRYLTQTDLQAFDAVLARAGSAPIRVSTFGVEPDSSGARAMFFLRMDQGDSVLLDVKEFNAEFVRAAGGAWQLFAVQRKD